MAGTPGGLTAVISRRRLALQSWPSVEAVFHGVERHLVRLVTFNLARMFVTWVVSHRSAACVAPLGSGLAIGRSRPTRDSSGETPRIRRPRPPPVARPRWRRH